MGFSVRSVENTNNLASVVKQLNMVNNEMTQDLDLVKTALRLRESDVAALRKEIDSLSVKLGEFSASSVKGQNINKKIVGKNVKLGITKEATAKISTLFKNSSGSLIWKDDNGVETVIVS